MEKELREKAEKKVKAKMGFYILSIVFFFTTMVLVILSFALPAVAFWLLLPIPVFIMVLGIVYLSVFGLPISGVLSEDWREEEIKREMEILYRQQASQLPPQEEPSATEDLELKELERLEEREDWDEDYV